MELASSENFKYFKQALETPKIQRGLQNALSPMVAGLKAAVLHTEKKLDSHIEESLKQQALTDERLTKLEESGSKTVERASGVEVITESHEEDKRNLNLFIKGLHEREDKKAMIHELADEIMGLNLCDWEIAAIFRVTTRNDTMSVHKVIFTNIFSRNRFYRARGKIGEASKIWINEDLCPNLLLKLGKPNGQRKSLVRGTSWEKSTFKTKNRALREFSAISLTISLTSIFYLPTITRPKTTTTIPNKLSFRSTLPDPNHLVETSTLNLYISTTCTVVFWQPQNNSRNLH